MKSATLFLLGLVPSAMAEMSCGVSHGYDLGTHAYYYSGDGSLSTFDACSAQCQTSSECQSFAFGAEECLLYTAPLDTNFRQQQNSPFLFYDRDCVKIETVSNFPTSLPPATTAASPVTPTTPNITPGGQPAPNPQTTADSAASTATPGSSGSAGSNDDGDEDDDNNADDGAAVSAATTRVSAVADVTAGSGGGDDAAAGSAGATGFATVSGSGTATSTGAPSLQTGAGGVETSGTAPWGGQRSSWWLPAALGLGAAVVVWL